MIDLAIKSEFYSLVYFITRRFNLILIQFCLENLTYYQRSIHTKLSVAYFTLCTYGSIDGLMILFDGAPTVTSKKKRNFPKIWLNPKSEESFFENGICAQEFFFCLSCDVLFAFNSHAKWNLFPCVWNFSLRSHCKFYYNLM